MEKATMGHFIIVSLMLTLVSEPLLTNALLKDEIERASLSQQAQAQHSLINSTDSFSEVLHGTGSTGEEGAFEGIVQFERFLADEKAKLLSSTLYLEDVDNRDKHTSSFDYPQILRNCTSNINDVIEAARKRIPWALQMLDSMGKPSSGILRHNDLFVGDFDQCMDVETGLDFEGQYCKARLSISKIRNTTLATKLSFVLGFCFPCSCKTEDVEKYINQYLQSSPDISAIALQTICQERHLPLTTKAKWVLCICSIFVSLILIATFYDVVYKRWWLAEEEELQNASYDQSSPITTGRGVVGPNKRHAEHEPILYPKLEKPKYYSNIESAQKEKSSTFSDVCDKLLTSFSAYSNVVKLFAVNQSQDSIGCIHGLRFVSMTWVILVHTHRLGAGALENVVPFLDKSLDDWTYMAVIKGVDAVNTFFAITGLLVTFLTLKKLTKEKPTPKFFGIFYLHRYLRLTLPYMLIIMTYVPLYKYISDGPLWPQDGIEINECEDSWWTNLLYLNNFIRQHTPCMGWAWYLACDMQFYLISPLMFLPLFYYEWKGLIVPFAFLLGNAICTGVISNSYDLVAVDANGPLLGMTPEMFDFYMKYYSKPYTRIGPFVIGVVTGFLLFKSECKARLPKLVVALGWTVATAMALAVIYGPHNHLKPEDLQSTDIRALYNALHSIAWGISICWVIFACVNGYGGFVNTLLSWKPLIPLSRLSYCAYLVHPLVIQFYFFSQRKPFYMDNLSLSYAFVAVLVLSNAVAFIAYMAYEIPMTELEKVIRGHGKKK